MVTVCVGIAKKWSDCRIKYDKKGVRGGKKYLHAYFYDENGKFFTKRISRFEAIKLEAQGIYRKKYFICQLCGCKFLGLVRNKSDIPDCPNCS